MFLMSDDRIDRTIHFCRHLFIGGLSWFLLMAPLPKPLKVLVFTSFMVSALGLFAFCLQKWRFDRGLWMLATLLVVIYAPICAFFYYLEIMSLINPAPAGQALMRGWDEIRLALDCSLALLLTGKIVRFSLSVSIRNWQLTHPRSRDE